MSPTIELTSALTNEDAAVLRRYLADPFHLSDQDWQRLRAVIDSLSQSTVVFGDRRYRFKRFYAIFINGTYARPYLQQLGELDDLQREGVALQASIARKLMAWLRANGLIPTLVSDAEYLIVYCLYWWAAFARGYLFEQIIIRDLTADGIDLQAHAPEKGTERYTPFDLMISPLGKGDIKTSIYFLDAFPDPPVDFYITRLYDVVKRKVIQAVFLKPAVWQRIDGHPQAGSVIEAPRIFPRPVVVQIAGMSWVMVEYALWKKHLLNWQQKGTDNE